MRSTCYLLSAVLIGSMTPAQSAEELLCADWENPIAEDMQIRESDLTFEEAEKALTTLRDYKPETSEMNFGYLNSAKIVQGYSLRQVALTLKSEYAVKEFCTWLTKDGFWYD
jgi:hypothetical protein